MDNKFILLNKKTTTSLLLITFVSLLLSSFILIPYVDSYYYWNWGRHLALSYYDGPPIIAYMMRLYTELMGNTTYAINLLGVSSIFLTMVFIFKTAEMLFNKQVALNACLLWLFSTPVFHYLFLWVTYDNPLNLFWAAALYFTLRYIQYSHIKDIYFVGISAGFLLLSKYSGLVLLLALFTFIVFVPKYRKLFKNKHFYLSMLITFLISSPIIIWNYQHAWGSVFYQFNYHLVTHKYETSFLEAILRYAFKIIKNFDILLILPFFLFFKTFKTIKQNDSLLLLNWISLFFIAFYLFISLQNSISKHWLTPYAISSTILCSYYFSRYQLRQLYLLTISFYILLGIYYIGSNCLFQQYFDEDYLPYALIQEAGRRYGSPNLTVVTADWQSASRLSFWLPGKPEVRTIPCGIENQYAIWNHHAAEIPNALYLDFIDRSNCIKQYFTHCRRLPPLTGRAHYLGFDFVPGEQLFAYYCHT